MKPIEQLLNQPDYWNPKIMEGTDQAYGRARFRVVADKKRRKKKRRIK